MPRLTGLRVADDPETWEALGFAVRDGRVRTGGVAIELAGRDAGEGILGWTLDGDDGGDEPQPNGVTGVDHVVAVCGDLETTMADLAADGFEARRVRDAGNGVRQAFYVLETALLELAGPVEGETAKRFWGVTLVATDLDALAARLGPLLGAPRDAVQPGRRIATLRREAGSSTAVAFLTPR